MLYWSAFVLERRINQPLPAVRFGLHDRSAIGLNARIVLGDAGELRVDSPLRPTVGSYALSWRAEGRLTNRRGRLVARVEIEIDEWSADATRLQLRPRARHPERWSGWRLRRYFALAHRAADHSARRIDQLAATPDRDWLGLVQPAARADRRAGSTIQVGGRLQFSGPTDDS